MPDLPESLQPLLDRIVQGFRQLLGDNLVGIYLHGSLAMDSFNPHASDIDFLVVVRNTLDLDTKHALVRLTLDLAADAPPKGLELSVVLVEYTRQIVYPTPFELHYSPAWHDAYLKSQVDLVTPQVDADLAGHFMITRRRGRCLYGQPIDAVFGAVPQGAYRDSILRDARQILDDITGSPVYSVLNLCRVIAYQQEGLITSKQEGGLWGLEHLDAAFHTLIQQALDAYQSSTPTAFTWDDRELERFGRYAETLLDSGGAL
jgi:predicted nucleotidyltransferase